MLKIYGQAPSRTFRVLWLCQESGIPFEHNPVSIGGQAPQCKEDWYVKLNPNARVPTIDDDGLVMWESGAINIYLAKKYKSPLWPRTLEGEARMLQWAFYIANDVEPPMIAMLRNRLVLPPDKRDPAAAQKGEDEIMPKLKVLDDHLARSRCFGGETWDMADFVVASVLFSLTAMKFDLAKFPKLEAWLKASVDRPAAKEAIKLRSV